MADESLAIALLAVKFPQAILASGGQLGEDAVAVTRERLPDVLAYLRREPQLEFDMLVDVTGVDHLGRREPRFDVVYHLLSLRHGLRLRIKAPVPEEDARLPSAAGIYALADWGEREVYDLFGIVFEGHPNLKRILLYEEFKGHPLRRDYPLRQRQPLVPYRAGACTEAGGRDCR